MQFKNVCVVVLICLVLVNGITWAKDANYGLTIYQEFTYVATDKTPVEVKINFSYSGDLDKLNEHLVEILLYEDDQRMLQINQPELKREAWGGENCYFTFMSNQIRLNKIELRIKNNDSVIFDLGDIFVQNQVFQLNEGGVNILSQQLPALLSDGLEIKLKNNSSSSAQLTEMITGDLAIFGEQVVIFIEDVQLVRKVSELKLSLEPDQVLTLRLPLDSRFIQEYVASDFYLHLVAQIKYTVEDHTYTIGNIGGKGRVNNF